MATNVLSDAMVINWIKTGLAINFTKDGLKEIAEEEVNEFCKQTFADVRVEQNISATTICSSCNNKILLQGKSRDKCPSQLCDNVRDKIHRAHRFRKPNWKNTNVSKWESSTWEVAKCFMSDGYTTKKSVEETDFNGIINFLINLERFDNKTVDDLSEKSNILTEARQVGRDFRHNELCKVSDTVLEDSIKKLTEVLEDPKYIGKQTQAQDALKQLEQLCIESWKITFEDIDTVIDQERAQDEIREKKVKMLEAIRQDIHRGCGELERHIQHGIKRIRRESDNQAKRVKQAAIDDYVEQKTDLRRKLITDVKSSCKTISISPFLEEEETHLLSFYVVPIMQVREHHKVKDDYTVESYTDIFSKGRYRCKKIYITGEAGVGKTTLCQRMALLWALSHSTSTRSRHTFRHRDREDMETLKYFDFLFFVNLRETSKCQIEKIIHHQLFKSASDKEFLHKILEKEKCLIILDGLHEWSHSNICDEFIHGGGSNISIPKWVTHNFICRTSWSTYVVHISTKKLLESLRLKSSEIDREVVIAGMDTNAQITFVEHIAIRLNKKETIGKFFEDIEQYNMSDLLEIPSAAAHLVCLWVDNKLGNFSRSHLYGSIVDNMFKQALNNQRTHHDQSIKDRLRNPREESLELKIPECITQFQHLQQHLSILQKLFHLAFDSLFSVAGESVSYSNADVAKYGLSEENVEFLCLVGIFSKRKAIGYLTERKYKISFLNRCYQEYMAAVYIAMKGGNDRRVLQSISQVCKTYIDVKHFENMLIVLATIDPELLERVFTIINDAITTDQAAIAFREYSCSSMFTFISHRKQQIECDIKSLQDIAVKCREASHKVCSRRITVRIRDMFIYKNNIHEIAGLLTTGYECIQSIFISVWCNDLKDDLAKVKTLKKLEVRFIDSNKFHEITNVMMKSRSVLQNVFISYCEIRVNIPVKKLTNLKSVYLYRVELLHNPLKELLHFMSCEIRLSQIGLEEVRCLEHGDECRLDDLDLSSHPRMYLLGVCDVNVASVYVDPTTLERLLLNCTHDEKNICIEPFLKSVLHAPVLKKIVIRCVKNQRLIHQFVQTIGTLPALRYVHLLNVNFFEEELTLHNDVKNLEVELSHIDMSHLAFEHFLDSVEQCQNTTCVHLQFFRLHGGNKTIGSVIEKRQHIQIDHMTDVSIKFHKTGGQSAT